MATDDDGFREIQLSGKQLVFLFMAATVVSVVIFLSGVLVGRGVRAERSAVEQADALTESPTPDPGAPSQPLAALEADPRAAAPPAVVVGEPEGADARRTATPEPDEEAPVAIDRSASTRADARPASATTVATVAAPPKLAPKAESAAAPAPPPAPPATRVAAPAAAVPAPAAATDAPRTGYAVQVAAVDVRGEADAMVQRLTAKGYTAYVEQPKGSRMYRVRVGTYRTRREAQVVADKLKKEEKFNPWVTR